MRHHTLVVWQRADDLFILIHKLAREAFPSDERYELNSQVRRAAYSVAANIVEGVAREHPKERLQFLNIAWGSLAEVGIACTSPDGSVISAMRCIQSSNSMSDALERR